MRDSSFPQNLYYDVFGAKEEEVLITPIRLHSIDRLLTDPTILSDRERLILKLWYVDG